MISDSEGNFYADEAEHFLASNGIKIPVTGQKEGAKAPKTEAPDADFAKGVRELQDKNKKPFDPIEYFIDPPPKLPITTEPNRGNIAESIPVMRHGETRENIDNTAHGWDDEGLIPEGRKEVEKTANTLAHSNAPPTLIAHSDLKRAAESAEIVAKKTGAQTLAIPELRTWDIGDFAGKECGECEKELKQYVDNPDKPVPGGESFNQFKNRVQVGMGKALAAGADLVVAHNKTDRMIAALEEGPAAHENFDHKGGPDPGQLRRVQLAGDVVPFGLGQMPLPGARSTGARGRASINEFMDQGYFKGERYNPDLSNVEHYTGPAGKGKLTDQQKYDVAVERQQQGRGSNKNPMGKLLQFEREPEFKE